MIKQEKPEPQGHPKGPIFVPKTFGWGWTLNFARWESFVILAVIIGLIVGSWFYGNHNK
jgi:uncharacterized membrane protein